jgi:hypothetical protein
MLILGFLSPANRGALMTCALVLYVCLGTPAGYVAARYPTLNFYFKMVYVFLNIFCLFFVVFIVYYFDSFLGVYYCYITLQYFSSIECVPVQYLQLMVVPCIGFVFLTIVICKSYVEQKLNRLITVICCGLILVSFTIVDRRRRQYRRKNLIQLTIWHNWICRIYKSFGGEKWKSNVLLTCMLCPGIVFAHFFIMNLVSGF